jgi:hypothetical protein
MLRKVNEDTGYALSRDKSAFIGIVKACSAEISGTGFDNTGALFRKILHLGYMANFGYGKA